MRIEKLTPSEVRDSTSYRDFLIEVRYSVEAQPQETVGRPPQWLWLADRMPETLEIWASTGLQGQWQSAVWARVFSEVCEIDFVFTAPSLRGRGGARSVLKRLLEESAADQRFSEVWLEVDIRNAAAIALYESLGFKKGQLRKDYYGPDGHALNYRLELL